jgi:arabinose-5-phosphate isomerase
MEDIERQLAGFNDTVVSMLENVQSRYRDFAFFQDAVKLITEAREKGNRLHITGIGKPHHVANLIASLFSSIGTPCYFLDGTEATHGSSGQVEKDDIVICISYYGNVPELIGTITTLKSNGAKIIGVTGFADSWIARNSDVHLDCFVEKEGDYLNKPPRTSMLSTIYLLMNLSLILQCLNDMTPEKYIRFHPSGKLGKL